MSVPFSLAGAAPSPPLCHGIGLPLYQSHGEPFTGPAVTESLIALCREVSVGGRQIHDANIVVTMLAHGERRLLTFNTADFRRYGDRIELVGGQPSEI